MDMAASNRRSRTDLSTWDPFEEFQRLTSQLSRFPDSWDATPAPLQGFVPMADVEETDDAYLVEIELPGVDRNDIDVSLDGRRLTVSGERKEKERVGILRRRTRTMGRFIFDIQLPAEVDASNISAILHDGVLTVRVPRATTAQPRHVEIK
jgi:HSP20 family protein